MSEVKHDVAETAQAIKNYTVEQKDEAVKNADYERAAELRDKCESLLRDARTLLEQVTTHVDMRLAELIENTRASD